MRSKLSWAAVLSLLAVRLVMADEPATRPLTDPIELRDYCTVALAPKLQDRLATSAEQQAVLSKLNVQLHAELDNAAGNVEGTAPTPGAIAARGEVVLGHIGTQVRDALTATQRATLASLFDDHTLKPISLRGSVHIHRRLGESTISASVILDYTHYGETPVARTPTTRRTPAQVSPPLAGESAGTPSPGRLRRMPHVDVPKALAKLDGDSLPSQMVGAGELSRAVPDDAHRRAVLSALRPFVNDPGDEHWASFAVAFCRWADVAELPTITTVLTTSDGLHAFDQKESSSAAACAALLRLDPDKAVPAINARVNNDLFRVHLINLVRDLGEQGDASKPIADDVLDQLIHHGATSPPIAIHVPIPTAPPSDQTPVVTPTKV